MSDVQNREPVDNSHRDAGIAARESQKEAAATAESAAPKAEQEAKPDVPQEKAKEEATGRDEPQNTSEESADSESGDAPAQQSRKKPGVHQRIDELTKSFREAEREREYWREQALRAQQQPQQDPKPAQAAPPEDSGEPTLESCDYDPGRYQREMYQYLRKQERQQEAQQAKRQKFEEKEAAFRVAHPDYDQLTRNPALPITEQVADVIYETDDPPAVAYYLANNPAEAAAIAQMTPHQIGRAIGRIEAKLSAPAASEAPRQPEPKTVTKAPAPVTTVSGSPAVKKSYADMSPKEYDAVRRKERAEKGLAP